MPLSDHHLDQLAEQGWVEIEDFVPTSLCQDLQAHLEQLSQSSQLKPAGIGKQAQRSAEMRSDHIHWLDPATSHSTEQAWLKWTNDLRQELNQSLFIGAQDYEGHLALYPEGSFYKPHLDQHKGQRSRLITVILYLTPNWQDGDGGELKFYTDPEKGVEGHSLTLRPIFGKVVLFRSDLFWHEVLPANTNRYSLTGWLRKG